MDRKENTPTKGRGNCVAETRDSTANHPVPQSLPVQRTHLLKHLQERGRITTIEARNILGIMHPAARIQELRESGYNIETYWQLEADVTGKRHKQGLYVLMTGKGGAA